MDHGTTHNNNTHTRTLHQQLNILWKGCNLCEIYYALLVTQIREEKFNRKISTHQPWSDVARKWDNSRLN